jgi:hypothetical protein
MLQLTTMPTQYKHSWLLSLPVTGSPAAGLLEAGHLDTHSKRTDLLLDYHELQISGSTELFERDYQPWERGQGKYVPRRLRFVDARIVEGRDLLTRLGDLPPQDPSRILNAVLAWRNPEGQNNYLFDLRSREYDTLLFIASRGLEEPRMGFGWETRFERNWSPPPLSPARLIPNPQSLRHRYGGDPVSVRIGERMLHRRLFIGGLDNQSGQRPEVSAVLNLGEEASLWAENERFPGDRWACKGEGSRGMTVRDLVEESEWVIDRLERDERVLVHCSAGMNRSSSICCAVLIRLEGLSAEAALERVREHHPWARPDPHHWLALRWLGSQTKGIPITG